MVKERTYTDPEQKSEPVRFIYCPRCRQKLADLRNLNGDVQLRFCCRRCGTFILSDIHSG